MSAPTPWFIRARLKTRQLMLLTAICDEGNIHRAAEVLNMSQPAASKLLKDLEDMLGVALEVGDVALGLRFGDELGMPQQLVGLGAQAGDIPLLRRQARPAGQQLAEERE